MASFRQSPSAPVKLPLAVLAGYVVLYVFLDWISYIHPVVPQPAVTPWNPPPGLSMVLLLLAGPSAAGAVFVAALSAELLVRGLHASLPYLVASAGVLAAGYAAVASVLSLRAGFDVRFDSLRALSRFCAVIVPGSFVVCFAFVGVYVAAGLVPGRDFLAHALLYWLGDVIGIMVTTPFLLVHLRRARRERALPVPETLVQGLSLVLALWLVFGTDIADEFHLFYLLFLPLTWIAMRRGIAGASTAILVIQVGLIIAVEVGGYHPTTYAALQLLMLALAVVGLFLGMAVSDRERAQDILAEREAQFAAVIATAPDGIVSVDECGTVLSANAAAERIFGQPLAGKALQQMVEAFPGPAEVGENVEVTGVRSDGSRFPAEISFARAESGRFIGMLRDVSRRKDMEERLLQREAELNRALRMASMGEMASGIAHELNQPLAAIATYIRSCQLMLESGQDGARVREVMDKVAGEAVRAGQRVLRLRDFFRGGILHLEQQPLETLLRGGADPIIKRAERLGVRLEWALSPDLPMVLADRVQIETVVHNLLSNALDALAEVAPGDRMVRVEALPLPDGVRVCIGDTGPGIAADMSARVFEPFVTSKAEGMGLGLAISRSLIEAHGGRLWVAAAPAGGANFCFTLPHEEPSAGRDRA